MRNRFSLAIAAICAASLWLADEASAAKRIALVVGNDNYQNLTQLGKAVNDSRSVARALEEIGFSVIHSENTTRRDMNRRLSELDGAILPGDTVFFFYAGHGVALGSENYLLPTDIPKPKQGEDGLVRDEAHSVDSIIRRIQERGAAVAMVVLDACRDNPFAASGTRNLGAQRGLARIDTPDGVFVLYSAGIGQTALDGLGPDDPDENSVFTRKLVPLLKTAGMTHVALAKTVQQQVDELARTVHHPQQPAYYDQIIGEIVLKPTSGQAPAAVVDGTGQPISEAAEAWVTVNNSTSIAVLEAYIARYKGTVFADLAQARLDEVRKTEVASVGRTVVVEPKSEGHSTEAAAADTADAAPAETTVIASVDATEVASAETAEPATTAEPTDPSLLARQLQTELKRVGCYLGEVDGDWGRGSASALDRFNEAAGLELSVDEPTGDALDAVTAKTEAVCNAELCTGGLEPDGSGNCVKAAKKAKAEPQSTKSTRTKAKATGETTPTKKAARRSRTVTSETPKKKSMITKSGKFDCAIYGTNTALQDLHRRQGHCE